MRRLSDDKKANLEINNNQDKRQKFVRSQKMSNGHLSRA